MSVETRHSKKCHDKGVPCQTPSVHRQLHATAPHCANAAPKPPRSARPPHVLNPENLLFRHIRRTFPWATSGNSAPLSCWQIIEESIAGVPHDPAASAAAVWLVAKTSSGEQSRSKRMVSAPRRSEQQSTCAASQPRSLHSSAIPAAGTRQTSTCFLESNSRMCGYPKP